MKATDLHVIAKGKEWRIEAKTAIQKKDTPKVIQEMVFKTKEEAEEYLMILDTDTVMANRFFRVVKCDETGERWTLVSKDQIS